ncbi:MAG: DUF1214 domain-containing protein [Halioglobus sp.]
MKKYLLCLVAGAILGISGMLAKDFSTAKVIKVSADADMEASFDALAKSILDAGEFVKTHRYYGSEREQVEAYRHLIRSLMWSLESRALQDRSFLFFQEMNPINKMGMDNSDQRYLIARLEGEAEYRIWGHRGSSRRLDFAIYEGLASTAAAFATLSTDDLAVNEDGSFELFIGGEPRPQNWLPGPSGEARLMTRQIFSDWATEQPGQLHIDRIDAGRPPYPRMTRQLMAERLRVATDFFAEEVRKWPEFQRSRFDLLMPANWLTPPQDTSKEGGLAGRWMVGGHFDLAEDQALIITAWPSKAAYQGIQLGHPWWESIDYAHHQASLSVDQARLSSDGAYHFVISLKDPGVPNWLDPAGFHRGVILMRYDGMRSEIEPGQEPAAKLVTLAELRQYLPADEPQVSSEERALEMTARRRHVQERFGF